MRMKVYYQCKNHLRAKNRYNEGKNLQNLTQKQLAVKLNEQVSVIQGYENGSIIPTGLKLANLQKALDCKLPKPPKPPKPPKQSV